MNRKNQQGQEDNKFERPAEHPAERPADQPVSSNQQQQKEDTLRWISEMAEGKLRAAWHHGRKPSIH